MVARWIANLILLLMLIGLALGIRYELMVTDLAPQQIGDAATAPRRIELEPAQPDTAPTAAPGQSSAPPAASRSGTTATPDAIPRLGTAPPNRSPGPPAPPGAGPMVDPVESPPVVHLKPEPGLPNQDQDQVQDQAEAAPEVSPSATPPKAPPMGFGVDPFAPDEVPPSPVVRSKTGGAPAPRRH